MSNESQAGGPATPMSRFRTWLATPVSGASLAIFRFCVGLVMALEAYTLCVPSASTFNQVPLDTFYTGPDIKFRVPYAAFDWLPVLSPFGIHVVVALLAIGGICLAIGLFHRIAAALVFLTWGYLYAIESTRTYWMSYYYLELLVCFLLIWMPASRRFSVDAWLNRKKGLPDTVPFWTLVLLRGQLVITYFYAGVAKVNVDWLVDGEPVRYFLSRARLIEELGPKLSESQAQTLNRILHSETLTYIISWLGAGFDVSVGFLLLFRRTRIFALVLMVIFHSTNHLVLFKDIHWFPLVGLTTALIFLDADWPDRFWRWVRKPKVAKPDWRYFIGGGVLFPVVGTALGWRLAPTRIEGARATVNRLGTGATALVVAWLGWQAVNPLRQYLVPVDSRFTWEGLSFCWRLKAEVYRCVPSKVFIADAAIISPNTSGTPRIIWDQWQGPREIYRELNPKRIEWSQMPEVLVVLEPHLGERLIYNPYSGSMVPRTEKESLQRISQIWKERYGRTPPGIRRTVPLDQVAKAYASVLQSRGTVLKDREEISAALSKLIREDGKSEFSVLVRRVNPFGLEGAPPTTQPLFMIEDDALLPVPAATNSVVGLPKVVRAAWKTGSDTLGPESARHLNEGGEPLLLFCSETLIDEGRGLPEALMVESQYHPDRPVQIRWNYMTELTQETRMHISMQPFLLRRYARHVASLWEKSHGHRPGVQASTAVSLNGRPAQMLVDPQADLATVSVALWGHNAWIRDLEVPRIPKGGIKQ